MFQGVGAHITFKLLDSRVSEPSSCFFYNLSSLACTREAQYVYKYSVPNLFVIRLPTSAACELWDRSQALLSSFSCLIHLPSQRCWILFKAPGEYVSVHKCSASGITDRGSQCISYSSRSTCWHSRHRCTGVHSTPLRWCIMFSSETSYDWLNHILRWLRALYSFCL